jgi:hypothetical protein
VKTLVAVLITFVLCAPSHSEYNQCDVWSAEADLYYQELVTLSYAFQSFYSEHGTDPSSWSTYTSNLHTSLMVLWETKSMQYDEVQDLIFANCDALP